MRPPSATESLGRTPINVALGEIAPARPSKLMDHHSKNLIE